MRHFLSKYFGEQAVGSYIDREALAAASASPNKIAEFVLSHKAHPLSQLSHTVRYALLNSLIEGESDKNNKQQEAAFSLLFTAPYPAEYEEFENRWAERTAQKLVGTFKPILSYTDAEKFVAHVQNMQLEAYKECGGQSIEPARNIEVLYDPECPHQAYYQSITQKQVYNMAKLPSTQKSLCAAALHEGAHHASIHTIMQHVYSQNTQNTPYLGMAQQFNSDYLIYNSISDKFGAAIKKVLLVERVAHSYEVKTLQHLHNLEAKPEDKINTKLSAALIAWSGARNDPPNIRKLSHTLYLGAHSKSEIITSTVDALVQQGYDALLKRGYNAFSAASHRMR